MMVHTVYLSFWTFSCLASLAKAVQMQKKINSSDLPPGYTPPPGCEHETCEQITNMWTAKCTWSPCKACDECFCSDWCSDHDGNTTLMCAFDGCKKCSACDGGMPEMPATPSPVIFNAPSPANCALWCEKWPKKHCAYDACKGCNGCPVTPCDSSTSGTCQIYEDPHVQVFDGAQVSLLKLSDTDADNDLYKDEAGDKYFVKAEGLVIQARLEHVGNQSASSERSVFTRAVAVSGEFLKGNKLIIGSLEDPVTWNGMPILAEQESSFEWGSGESFVKGTRSTKSLLVEDMVTENAGINLELPSCVSLVVNRLRHRVNVAVTMPPQNGGQSGLCGNFNGLAVDDTIEMMAKVSDPAVPKAESLFDGFAFSD